MSRAEQAISQLLDDRGAGKTVCPSEAARLICPPRGDWRHCMSEVHEAVDSMVVAGQISLSWQGQPVERRRGPYRIARRRPSDGKT
ncbi:DUF3253 domain-containing protein [Erythrobacter sp. JK5]|uniref:DUF3253 domain-containing protein n=1 Tax=Erythrobacter sp. JK5 TaxID=2829500 RepID=UPI001BAA7FC1|nr:DUF3253 domain-containing protein [Erythrobacter sp. JK5]QUL37905.1 DUF3253 domain-containing protein [Erythrobacter sp. JK5]